MTSHPVQLNQKQSHIFKLLAMLVAAIYVVGTMMPLHPQMPSAGLDPSWMFAMNQTVANGLVFGRDSIFTFGPYAAIYTHVYHPATDTIALAGSLSISIALLLTLFALSDKNGYRAAYLAPIIFSLVSTDTILIAFPFLSVLLCSKSQEHHPHSGSRQAAWYSAILMCALAMAVLPFIKGTFAISSGLCFLFSMILLLGKREFLLANTFLCIFISGAAIFWLAAGQPLLAAPSYFSNIGKIISGYTEAMAYGGGAKRLFEVTCYLVLSYYTLKLWLRSLTAEHDSLTRLIIAATLLLTLFMACKAGFVRHDAAHVLTAFGAILFLSWLSLFLGKSNANLILTSVALFALLWASTNYSNLSLFGILKHAATSAPQQITFGISDRLMQKHELELQYADALFNMRQTDKFPVLDGTIDIYPTDQALVLAAGMRWSPRPIMQSYSAYTPALTEINKNHLADTSAPDNIIFSVAPINDRHPAMDDGPSWPYLLSNYQPTQKVGDYILLQHKPLQERTTPKASILSQYAFKLGSDVLLPNNTAVVWATIDVRPTLLGKLAILAFKTSRLGMSVEMENSKKVTYRFIPEMAQSLFMLSPAIQTTDDFLNLYHDSKPTELSAQKTASFNVNGGWLTPWLWQKNATITYYSVTL